MTQSCRCMLGLAARFSVKVKPIALISIHQLFTSFSPSSPQDFLTSSTLLPPPVPCLSNFTAPAGTVLSPDYPEGYGNNLNCVWLIIAEPGSRIHLAFNDFDLEPPYDFLTVRDGEQTDAAVLGRFTGAEVPSHLTSNSNVLQLEFQADHSMSGRGFNISYSSEWQIVIHDKILTLNL